MIAAHVGLGITADDFSDADGLVVLDFWQAQNKAREQMVERAHSAAGVSRGPKTVADALDSYLDFLRANRKSSEPELGHTKLNNLTTEQIRKWLNGIAAAPARVRTKLGAPQRFRADCGDPKTLMLPGFDTFPAMRFLAS